LDRFDPFWTDLIERWTLQIEAGAFSFQ